MLVTSLLLVAAFTSANSEIHLTATDRAQKKAYYAAVAGIDAAEGLLAIARKRTPRPVFATARKPQSPPGNGKRGGLVPKVPLKTS